MDDLISRQDAIDTIGNVPDYGDGIVWEALSHAQRDVALLPSAQPERKADGDTINRQAAIDALYHVDEYNGRSVEAIRNLPSAERRGRWKQVGDDTYRCSACGEISCCKSLFCGDCGARMEETP